MGSVTRHKRGPGGADLPSAPRRRVLHVLAASACMLVVRPASATRETLAAALRETFGQSLIAQERVTLELPLLAESGNVVPVTVKVDSPMSETDHVTWIHLFAEKNHLPQVVSVRLGPRNGKAVFRSRIRLAESQQVLAVAVMSDGSLYSDVADVEVTYSSCG